MRAAVLSIAGSDPSGGAGIQADLKTFQAFGVYGAAVLTSLTAQNTTGVRARHDVPAAFVAAQLDAVLDDFAIAAAKSGLLPDASVVDVVVERFARPGAPPLVVDPVLVATSGDALTGPSALAAIRDRLLPIACVVTPNLSEVEALTGRRVTTVAAMRDAAVALLERGPRAVLVKGGHLPDRACDVLATAEGVVELDGPRHAVGPTHGTGCALSAAIAAEIALGLPMLDAVRSAKDYVGRAIGASVARGRGSRVLDHGA
jgi:hydroxymethylpyrimidine/phosphomethylpyrimidine kinase